MKLSTRLSLFVLVCSVIGIIVMSTSFYQLSKSFYKNQLQKEIEYRLAAHGEIVEDDMTAHTLHHVVLMEKRDPETFFIIMDQEFNVLEQNYPVSEQQLQSYRKWIQEKSNLGETEFIETMARHIPHIWSFVPLTKDEDVLGYLFIDQDTGDFNQAQTKLLYISIIMALLTLLLSGLITIYLSKRLTAPLIEVRNSTRKIAKGDFDFSLVPKGNDEITDLIKDISNMASQLKDYRDSRQQFLSNVSHDLRTPLTYLKGYAAILKDKPHSSKDVMEYSKTIYSEAIRMERLVNDLFQLMKLDEGKFKIEMRETDIVALLSHLLQKVKLRAKEKNIDIRFSSNTNPIVAMVDSERMEQAILNLVTNAIHYTEPGGCIEISVEKQPHQLILQVKDNGQGIPEQDLPYIWERFYRVDKARSSVSGGSGLGLTITKQLIELQGGVIMVNSIFGKGTCFIIKFDK